MAGYKKFVAPDEEVFFKQIQEIAKFDFHKVRPIVWEDYAYKNRNLTWVAEQVERILKETEKKFPGIFDLSGFHCWRMEDYSNPKLGDYIGPDGRRVPIWSMALFSYFLDDNGNITADNILNQGMKILLNKPRQVGATEAWSVIIILLGCWTKDTKIALAYSSMAQFNRVFQEKMVKYCPYLLRPNTNKKVDGQTKAFYYDKMRNVLYINDNPLIVAGVDTVGDALRGLADCKILLIDEFDYVKKHNILTDVLFPMVNKAGGAVIGITTPREDGLMTFLDNNRELADYMGYQIIKFNILQANVCSVEQAKRYMFDFFRNKYVSVYRGECSERELYEVTAQEYMNYVSAQIFQSNYLVYSFKENMESIIYKKEDEPDNFTDKQLYPKKYIFIDHGESASNPAAVLFVAVNRYGQAYVFDELYLEAMPIAGICNRILRKCDQWNMDIKEFYTYIDPTLDNKRLITETDLHGKKKSTAYRENGVRVRLPRTMRNAEENELLNDICFTLHNDLYNPITGKYGSPYIFISTRCENLLRELDSLIIDRTKTTNQYTNMKHNHCLTGDTLVDTVKGQIPIKDLVGKRGWLYSASGKIRPFLDVRQTGEAEEIWEVKFDDGTVVNTTFGHLFAISDTPFRGVKEYVSTWDLKRGMKVLANDYSEGFFQRKVKNKHLWLADKLFWPIWERKKNDISFDEQLTEDILTYHRLPSRRFWQYLIQEQEHSFRRWMGYFYPVFYHLYLNDPKGIGHRGRGYKKVVSVKKTDRIEPTYNLEVPETHCFSVNGGVIVHNCYDALTLSLAVITDFYHPPKPDGQWRLEESYEDRMERFRQDGVLIMKRSQK